ncbi:hypothetical protein [Rhodococcus opacus]|uniref:hypothetical protein n=1 Tax=Rhodococcus opacus TaxID=37919 RepID=UPI0022360F4C|nr:hypothetical protein [Rhodococcus opacus]UZG60326.1 hypothetical protein ONE62_42430 [Rhodococcus opacus]
MASLTHPLEVKYRRARLLNVVLGVVVVFLGIVLAAQLLPGPNPTTAGGTTRTRGITTLRRRDRRTRLRAP